MKYKFIDIGCGHVSVSSDIFGTDEVGMYVEPIKKFLDVLPSGPNIIKEECAITETNGEVNLYAFIPEHVEYFTGTQLQEIFKDKEKEKEFYSQYPASNCSSLFYFDIEYFQRLSKKIKVKSKTLETLFDEHKVTEVDYLKIDVEGAESIVLNQLIKLMEKRSVKVNKQIKFEYCNLQFIKELDKIAEYLEKHFNFSIDFEYTFPWDNDLVLSKKD